MRRKPREDSPSKRGGKQRRQKAAPQASLSNDARQEALDRTAAARDLRAATMVCCLLLLAVALVFGQTLQYGFVNYDDNLYVYENPHLARGLTAEGIGWSFTTARQSLWAPLTWSSYLLDFQLYGLRPWGYHLTNVLLHAATTIILFLVLRRMTGDLWPSALVAVVFAIHPQHVESAAWVAERKGLLSGLFFMLALWAYLGYVRRAFSPARYAIVAMLFTLGLTAKPMLVTLPFVLLLLDYWPLGRMGSCRVRETHHGPTVRFTHPTGTSAGASPSRLWGLIVEKIPLVALAAFSCVVTLYTQSEALTPNEHFSVYWRIGNALISYCAYLGQFFSPAGLSAAYPRLGLDLPPWEVLGAAILLSSITAAALVSRRRRPYLLVGWLWYLATLLPVIGLVQFGVQATADRFMYLPQIGLCIALAWWAAAACRTWPRLRPACGVAAALALAVLTAVAWRQTTYWRDSRTLWTRAIDCTARNATAHTNLGMALADLRRFDEAAAQFRKSLAINSDDAKALCGLGAALEKMGQADEAMAHYEAALRADPGMAQAHSNLGANLADRGRMAEAMDHYQTALQIDPECIMAHSNLGAALAQQGRIDEAMEHLHRALEIKPDCAGAHANLGAALACQRRFDEATTHFRQALELDPESADACSNLAQALAIQGRIDEAMPLWRKALDLATRQDKRPLAESIRAKMRLIESGALGRAPSAP
jgi:protein O-mannosyl-transferase